MEEVFDAKDKKSQTFDEFSVTSIAIKRALSSIFDSSESDDYYTSAINYILRIAGWEILSLANAIAVETLESISSSRTPKIEWKKNYEMKTAQLVYLYIGKGVKPDTFRFTVKVVLSSALKALKATKSTPRSTTASPTAEGGDGQPKESYYIYYRHFQPTREEVLSSQQQQDAASNSRNKSSKGKARSSGKGKEKEKDPLPPPLLARPDNGSALQESIQLYVVDYLSRDLVDQLASDEEPIWEGQGAQNEGAGEGTGEAAAGASRRPAEAASDSDEASSRPWGRPDDPQQEETPAEGDEGDWEKVGMDMNSLSELMVWGFDSFGCSGLDLPPAPHVSEKGKGTRKDGDKDPTDGKTADEAAMDAFFVPQPRPIPLQRAVCLQKVRMLACSARHTLLLTHFGSIYSCGENSEGALGLGDLLSRYSDFPSSFFAIRLTCLHVPGVSFLWLNNLRAGRKGVGAKRSQREASFRPLASSACPLERPPSALTRWPCRPTVCSSAGGPGRWPGRARRPPCWCPPRSPYLCPRAARGRGRGQGRVRRGQVRSGRRR